MAHIAHIGDRRHRNVTNGIAARYQSPAKMIRNVLHGPSVHGNYANKTNSNLNYILIIVLWLSPSCRNLHIARDNKKC